MKNESVHRPSAEEVPKQVSRTQPEAQGASARTGSDAHPGKGQPTILDRIVETKRAEVARLEAHRDELREGARKQPPPRPFGDALRARNTVALLAEVKRRSPSVGAIRDGIDPVAVARAYARGGAAALSVLTDRTYFGGSLDDLRAVRQGVALPVLRKDFIIDPVQVWEARAAGADAVLLITRILDDALLGELLGDARKSGMDALVEVHDAAELDRALAAGACLVGINNRDLATFTVDLARSVCLAPGVPAAVMLVAESGIRDAADVRRLGAAGIDAVLVGESLMRAHNVGDAAAALVGHSKNSEARS